MSDIIIDGVVYKNGSATLLARIVGADGEPVQQADLAAITYTIDLLNEHRPDVAVVVTGHEDVALTTAEVIFDTLKKDTLWGTEDAVGYNFKHRLDISENQAFAIAGRTYRVTVTLTPTTGQPILARFLCYCI